MLRYTPTTISSVTNKYAVLTSSASRTRRATMLRYTPTFNLTRAGFARWESMPEYGR